MGQVLHLDLEADSASLGALLKADFQQRLLGSDAVNSLLQSRFGSLPLNQIFELTGSGTVSGYSALAGAGVESVVESIDIANITITPAPMSVAVPVSTIAPGSADAMLHPVTPPELNVTLRVVLVPVQSLLAAPDGPTPAASRVPVLFHLEIAPSIVIPDATTRLSSGGVGPTLSFQLRTVSLMPPAADAMSGALEANLETASMTLRMSSLPSEADLIDALVAQFHEAIDTLPPIDLSAVENLPGAGYAMLNGGLALDATGATLFARLELAANADLLDLATADPMDAARTQWTTDILHAWSAFYTGMTRRLTPTETLGIFADSAFVLAVVTNDLVAGLPGRLDSGDGTTTVLPGATARLTDTGVELDFTVHKSGACTALWGAIALDIDVGLAISASPSLVLGSDGAVLQVNLEIDWGIDTWDLAWCALTQSFFDPRTWLGVLFYGPFVGPYLVAESGIRSQVDDAIAQQESPLTNLSTPLDTGTDLLHLGPLQIAPATPGDIHRFIATIPFAINLPEFGPVSPTRFALDTTGLMVTGVVPPALVESGATLQFVAADPQLRWVINPRTCDAADDVAVLAIYFAIDGMPTIPVQLFEPLVVAPSDLASVVRFTSENASTADTAVTNTTLHWNLVIPSSAVYGNRWTPTGGPSFFYRSGPITVLIRSTIGSLVVTIPDPFRDLAHSMFDDATRAACRRASALSAAASQDIQTLLGSPDFSLHPEYDPASVDPNVVDPTIGPMVADSSLVPTTLADTVLDQQQVTPLTWTPLLR